ncbi:hypothetical protein OESDEN_10217 [Oesophagostomum dentatum]|uniref:Uncharacterized protein n=1 Tax=Oesophagostomum dentatum TaxID=61180 RepID=A0A0B1T2C2_OESDE|nr:hypothetical protein OESDEN_10217 [Oesophagostomum dentatum]
MHGVLILVLCLAVYAEGKCNWKSSSVFNGTVFEAPDWLFDMFVKHLNIDPDGNDVDKLLFAEVGFEGESFKVLIANGKVAVLKSKGKSVEAAEKKEVYQKFNECKHHVSTAFDRFMEASDELLKS